MGIYRIEFKECDYDQYDSFIVRAENEKAVEEFIKKEHPNEKWGDVDWKGGFEIIEITQEGKEEILLGSYNAG